jgi:hypothetical protein
MGTKQVEALADDSATIRTVQRGNAEIRRLLGEVAEELRHDQFGNAEQAYRDIVERAESVVRLLALRQTRLETLRWAESQQEEI